MKKRNSFIRTFGFMENIFPAYIISLIVVSGVLLYVQLSIAKLGKELFDFIILEDFELMIDTVKYYGIIIFSLFFFIFIAIYILNRIIAITTGKVRKTLFRKLEKLPVSYYKNNHSGDIVSRMTNDVSETEKIYDTYFADLFIQVVVGVGMTIAIYFYDWRFAIFAVAGSCLTLYINVHYAKILRILSKGVQEKLARLNETFTNLLNGVFIIKSFNIQHVIIDKIRHNNKAVYDNSIERIKTQSVVDGLNVLVGFLSFVGLTCMGSYLVIKGYGNVTIGVIVAVVQLSNGTRALARMLGMFITNIQTSLAAVDRVFEVIDEEDEPARYNLDSNNLISNNVIQMDKLSFKYDDQFVLEQLSLEVPKGKVYALVGPSGGGKSTVFKLLLNFYKPNSGDLIINGKSISEQDISDIREQMAYVPQDAYLFTGSITDNIRHGKMDASRDEIIEAAKSANAHKFIMELENGYDTKVGERGAQLSGGQRQRIAIARAILKNAPILLLDEATSALDTESEHLVQEALKKLMVGKTTLVVAHRLSTIQNANQILVLKDGCIVEQGTHDELLVIDGEYKNLYNKQFKLATEVS